MVRKESAGDSFVGTQGFIRIRWSSVAFQLLIGPAFQQDELLLLLKRQCNASTSPAPMQPQHLISDDDPSLRTHPAPGHALDASSFPRRSAPRRRGADTTRPAPTRHRSHYQTRERNHAPTLIARIHATSAEKQHQQVTPGCVRRRRRPPRAASPAGSARVQPGPVRQPPPPIGAARRVVIGSGGVWSGGRRMLRPGDRQQASSDAFLCLFFSFLFYAFFPPFSFRRKGTGGRGQRGRAGSQADLATVRI